MSRVIRNTPRDAIDDGLAGEAVRDVLELPRLATVPITVSESLLSIYMYFRYLSTYMFLKCLPWSIVNH